MRDPDGPGVSRILTAAAAFCLVSAAAASAVLAAASLRGLEAPGCGADVGCGRLLAGDWARLPGLGWPIAFVGVTYFPALLGAWAATRGRPGRWFHPVAWLGGAASVALVGVMAVTGEVCPWCLTVHAANLTFLGLLLVRFRPSTGRAAGAATFGAIFATLSTGLALATAAGEGREEARRSRSQHEVTAAPRDASGGFSGRYRLGPASAIARIVLFFDYGCGLCAEFERQADRLIQEHPRISLSVRHYPLDRACNPELEGPRGLGNSCRAARAAEAAGVLGGDRAFFAVHRWLFARRGVFGSLDELSEVIAGAGINFARYREAFDSAEVAENIAADVREAGRLGLLSTPMVFVNGVELKGLGVPEALVKTVEGVLASSPPARSAVADAPPVALAKAVADWADGPRTPVEDARGRWSRGPDRAAIDVVVWGDYLDEESRRLDRWLRDRPGTSAGFRYSFRHAPTGTASVEAATAAEAGGRLGGPAGFWAIHAWLMGRPGPFDLDQLGSDLAAAGIDRDRFQAARRSTAAEAAVEDDRAAAGRHGPTVLPLLWIDGRWAPRWRIGDRVVLEELLDAAARARATNAR